MHEHKQNQCKRKVKLFTKKISTHLLTVLTTCDIVIS